MNRTCLVPARLGSKRLPHKNLQKLNGVELVVRALRRAKSAQVFDEIWLSSESELFEEIAQREGVEFHRRDEWLGSDSATSEDFIVDFLRHHPTDFLIQLHSIAPLLSVEEIRGFVAEFERSEADSFFSVMNTRLECLFLGSPVNFSLETKTNSQEIQPVQEIVWSITGWRASSFLSTFKDGGCATYSGILGFFLISRFGAHVIKTQEDLDVAAALLPLAEKHGTLM